MTAKEYRLKFPSAKLEDDSVKVTRKKSCIKKYGVDNPFKLELTKNAAKLAFNIKYGSNTFFESDEGKKMINKLHLDGKCGTETDKFKRAIKEKYGVNNISQNENIKLLKIKSSKNKYGVNNISQSDEIKKKKKETDAVNGEKEAEAKRRIFVKEQEANAVKGENDSLANMAEYDSVLGVRRAEAKKTAEVALYRAEADIQVEKQNSELEKRRAEEVVPKRIEKEKIVIEAEAERERQVQVATGAADAIKLKYFAEAEGIKAVLEAKALGYNKIMESCNGDANAAASFLMIEKLTDIVTLQTAAIANIKFGNVTVWDSGGKTAEFASSLMGSLPPLSQIAKMAGFNLPEFLGSSTNSETPKGK